jgi:hypothetical protein
LRPVSVGVRLRACIIWIGVPAIRELPQSPEVSPSEEDPYSGEYTVSLSASLRPCLLLAILMMLL